VGNAVVFAVLRSVDIHVLDQKNLCKNLRTSQNFPHEEIEIDYSAGYQGLHG